VRRITICLFAALAQVAAHSECSLAQSYPDRPVKIVVGTTPGGQGDRIARLVGQSLSQLWGQPVVIENRPGADATIAAEAVAHAPQDGYTLLLAGQSNLVVAPALGRPLQYDPTRDFATIGRVARVPLGFVVRPSLPVKSIPDLIALAKAYPGRLTYGSSGSQSRLAVELLKTAEGLDIVEIPYTGSGTALSDLVAGRIDMMFFDLVLVRAHVDAGTLRLVAVASSRRAASAPDVPTVAEQGVRGFAVEPWYGLVAPARIPADTLALLRTRLAQLRRMPEIREQLEQLGYEPIEDSPEQFAADIVSDTEKFSAVIKRPEISNHGKPAYAR
jgi:tripartite-type tricarboxylate transporter receptor subunit TctC